ncbi:MAG: hypothetical protein AAFR79_10325 [Pseudomonadota bacterium]
MATPLSSDVVKRLLYGSAVRNRYLQGSPVLLDVWEGYAADPGGRLDLLITPYGEEPAHLVGDAFYGALRGPDGKDRARWTGFRPRTQADVSDVPGIVAARLRLDELTNIRLPLMVLACPR